MKTSTEMQLRILDKMRENVERDAPLFYGIAYLDGDYYCIDFILHQSDFYNFEFIIKPQTITINGVEIPKPLDKEEISVGRMSRVYSVSHKGALFGVLTPEVALDYGYRFVYRTEAEAITASKLLFGIK